MRYPPERVRKREEKDEMRRQRERSDREKIMTALVDNTTGWILERYVHLAHEGIRLVRGPDFNEEMQILFWGNGAIVQATFYDWADEEVQIDPIRFDRLNGVLHILNRE